MILRTFRKKESKLHPKRQWSSQLYQMVGMMILVGQLLCIPFARGYVFLMLPSPSTRTACSDRLSPPRKHPSLGASSALCAKYTDDEEEDDEEDNDDDYNMDDLSSSSISSFQSSLSKQSTPPSFGYNRGKSAPAVRKGIGLSSTSSAKVFVCTNCGAEYVQWVGKCSTCQSWNTVQEFKAPRQRGGAGGKNKARPVFQSSSKKSSDNDFQKPSSWLTGLDSGLFQLENSSKSKFLKISKNFRVFNYSFGKAIYKLK